MLNTYQPYVIPPCSDTEPPAPEPAPQPCPEWSVCLPWGGSIYTKDGCVYALQGNPPPDGVYDKIIIADGCITGVQEGDVPLYTGSPCAPLPGDCGISGGIGSPGVSGSPSSGSNTGGGCNCCTPSVTEGNLYACDATGKPLVRCFVQAGDNIVVEGNGTQSNPYIISTSGGSGVNVSSVYIRSANAAIAVTGVGTREDPFTLTHKTGQSGTSNGLTFDQFGHCTNIEAAAGATPKYITGVVGTKCIEVSVDNSSKIATIGLRDPVTDVSGIHQLGDYEVTTDACGRFSSFSYIPTYIKNVVGTNCVTASVDRDRGIATVGLETPKGQVAGEYRFGKYDVEVDKCGRFSSIAESSGGGTNPAVDGSWSAVIEGAFEGAPIVIHWPQNKIMEMQMSAGVTNAAVVAAKFNWPLTSGLCGILSININPAYVKAYPAGKMSVNGVECLQFVLPVLPTLTIPEGTSGDIKTESTTNMFLLPAALGAGEAEIDTGLRLSGEHGNAPYITGVTVILWPAGALIK